MSTVSSFRSGASSYSLGLPNHACPELLALTHTCVVLPSISFELISQGKTIPLTKQVWTMGKTGSLHLDPLYKLCAHSAPKDTTLFTALFAWHGHCLLEASRLTSVAGRNTRRTYTHTHTCTHARAHTNTYIHTCTNIEAHTYPRSHSGPLLGLAMVGAEKRSLLLLLGSSALTDPGGFTDFTVESAGLERPGL